MAIGFENVTADVIEASEFPEMAQAYGVSAVPKTVINDRVEFTGAVPEEGLLAAVRQAVGMEPEEPTVEIGQVDPPG
jgi:predicted DsbA family dithiol-disulfide isomerase